MNFPPVFLNWERIHSEISCFSDEVDFTRYILQLYGWISQSGLYKSPFPPPHTLSPHLCFRMTSCFVVVAEVLSSISQLRLSACGKVFFPPSYIEFCFVLLHNDRAAEGSYRSYTAVILHHRKMMRFERNSNIWNPKLRKKEEISGVCVSQSYPHKSYNKVKTVWVDRWHIACRAVISLMNKN